MYGHWINGKYQRPLHERKGKRWMSMGGGSPRELGKPKKKFEDTFSAETVLLETFFHTLPGGHKGPLDE